MFNIRFDKVYRMDSSKKKTEKNDLIKLSFKKALTAQSEWPEKVWMLNE